MQQTRRYILEILKELGQATVDDIVAELQKRQGKITAVTVRHHLTHLQKDALIAPPQLRHRTTPGRPQHTYELTEKAKEHFPTNYQTLVVELVNQIGEHLPTKSINVIFDGVASRMAHDANIPNGTLEQRLEVAVDYLTRHGYEACWEICEDGYILRTNNCPYHHISNSNASLCEMDMRLVASMIGSVPRLLSRVTHGDTTCAYLIPATNTQE